MATEEIIRRYAASGSSVILGRAGMLVLADHPNVLRVRLTGPLEARIAQAAQAYGLTREQARDQERDNDGPRAAWIRRFYGRDVNDLGVDSTRFRIEHCVALIVDAARAV
jgi:cytidylate kinase